MISAGLGAVLGGLISTAGSLYSNSANLDYAKDANKTAMAVAAQNNATQIEMANSAHQREVADLRAAGLNPILSAGGSGASTPSLQSGNLQDYHAVNPTDSLGQSARELGRLAGQEYRNRLDEQRAQIDALEATTQSTQISNTANALNSQADVYEAALRLDAMRDLYGGAISYDAKDGNRVDAIFDPQRHGESVNLMREGILADLKDRSNANWRNNLKTLTGAAGDVTSAVNLGAKGANTLRYLWRTR